jgi:transposase
MIGGALRSVIYICALPGVNLINYLIALQEYKNQMVKEPELWLSWCYQDDMQFSYAK